MRGLRGLLMVLVPVAGVLADGLGPVPSTRVNIGTVGSDRVLQGGCVYEVTTNSTFEGTKAGESGLIVKLGETAYIYIAKDKTLTCTGKDGKAAESAGAGLMPSSKPGGIITRSNSGVSWKEIEFAPASAGGGGKGATGGGAGIEVPPDSGLVVYGDGKLVARGGNGGKAAAGGAGAQGTYYTVTWFANDEEDSIKLYWDWKLRLTESDAGSITNAPGPVAGNPTAALYLKGAFAQPASGGGGGGGAGGGGAAIGSRGADGATGGSGGAVSGTTSDPLANCLRVMAGQNGQAASSAGACGSVWIGLSPSNSCELKPGEGGKSTGVPVAIDRDWVEFMAYAGDGVKNDPVRILFDNGQPGGCGGNGGQGATIGSGGTGGQGGQGGFGGGVTSYVEKGTVTNKDWVASTPGIAGTNGCLGVAREAGKIPVLVRNSEGKNVICFESLNKAVDNIVKNSAAYGSTITVIGSVSGENAKVPSGTTVIVEKNEYFREPGPNDLRQPYYLHPVPCDTNGDSRTYHYTFDTNKVVPVIGAFAFRTNKEAKCEAVITVTNALKDLKYRPFSSATLRDFTPEGVKTNVTENGRLTVTAGATEGKRFYRVGVTDDPR